MADELDTDGECVQLVMAMVGWVGLEWGWFIVCMRDKAKGLV